MMVINSMQRNISYRCTVDNIENEYSIIRKKIVRYSVFLSKIGAYAAFVGGAVAGVCNSQGIPIDKGLEALILSVPTVANSTLGFMTVHMLDKNDFYKLKEEKIITGKDTSSIGNTNFAYSSNIKEKLDAAKISGSVTGVCAISGYAIGASIGLLLK